MRGAPGGELAHQRARPRPAAVAIAGHGQHADVGEVDDDRLAAQRRAAVDQLARLLQRLWLIVGERVHPEVEVDIAVQRHCTGAEAHVQEVPVVGAALPDVLALDQQRPQAARVGVEPVQRGALELARRGQLGFALAQVLRVATGLLRRALAHAPLLRPAHADREEHQQQEHPARHVQERRVAVDERVADHPEPADDREQQLDDRGVGRSRLRRRRRDAQLLRRHGRRVLAGGSMEGQRVLCCHFVLTDTTADGPPRRGVC
jgi:hypothetical protein